MKNKCPNHSDDYEGTCPDCGINDPSITNLSAEEIIKVRKIIAAFEKLGEM